jgi:GDP-L-fucose synthase
LKLKNCKKAVKDMDVVFHLASIVAGIGYNISHHSEMFRINSALNTNVLEASRLENIDTYQCTSSTCIYPRDATIPTPEDEGFIGDPEPTVLGYGWAKRMAEIQARLYSRDYGMKISIIRPSNIYGPRDNFDLVTSHVIPALIRKMDESDDAVTIWGSGNQTRSFIYVEDITRAMLEMAESYAIADPLNIGTEEEVTIKRLANTIMNILERDLDLIFDTTKPEGQARKFADIEKAKKKIDWKSDISLIEGLKRTIQWYKNNKNNL